jgi:hypothetical protein
MNHAKTSFSTEIFAGAIISVVQYMVPLRFVTCLLVIVGFVTHLVQYKGRETQCDEGLLMLGDSLTDSTRRNGELVE